jgi:hypothetical protein
MFLYQQRLRAELLEKAADTGHQPWWSTQPPVVSGPIRSIMALRRDRYARNGGEQSSRSPSPALAHRPDRPLGLVALQGRVLGAVTAGLLRTATLPDLATQLRTGTSALREALRALRDGGWIAIQLLPADQLVIRLERRSADADLQGMPDRRVYADAWAL